MSLYKPTFTLLRAANLTSVVSCGLLESLLRSSAVACVLLRFSGGPKSEYNIGSKTIISAVKMGVFLFSCIAIKGFGNI